MSSNLQEKDRRFIWHPYTQMHDYAKRDVLLIDHAAGIFLFDHDGKRYFDTISSWWCIVHGHNHPAIQAAVAAQLARLDQVLLAGTSHEPAILLAEQLVQHTPAELSKVFYSDNGSTACEVAVKMSLQYWKQTGRPERKNFIGVERGYHGDTIGTMSLGGTPGFHGVFDDLMFFSHRIPSPYCYRCPMDRDSAGCDIECLTPLQNLVDQEGETIAAFIVEPLIQAAGGMIIYPPRYLKRAVAIVRKAGIHVILDEVATGFGRTGTMFALEQADISPDFLCLSKGITGGCLPLAATMTTEEIYHAFYGDYAENRTFYHGHTFSGNPLAAAAGVASISLFTAENTMVKIGQTAPYLHAQMQRFFNLPWVGDIRTLGMIAAVELVKNRETKEPFSFSDRVGWKIYLEGLKAGVILRPLGNVLYLWLPLITTKENIDEIIQICWDILSNPDNIAGLAAT